MKSIKEGDQFNRWTLIAYHSDYIMPKDGRVHGHYWSVRCQCGSEKVVLLANITRGLSKSCGCWNVEVRGKHSITHGASSSKTYKIWAGMKRRCFNPHEKFYYHYGGRGITVCDRWKTSFEAFFADMGECPEGYSIERKDVNGHYEPSNCVWLPEALQGQNTRKSKLDVVKAAEIIRLKRCGGRSKQIASIYGIDKTMVDKICRGECWKNAMEIVNNERT